jgi:hypothetical protein
MDRETLYNTINITKRDGYISPKVLRDELELSNKDIQTVLQSFIDTGFIDHKYHWTGPENKVNEEKAQKYDQLKGAGRQIFNIGFTVLFAGFIIYFSIQPKGTSSCTEEFLNGNISAELVQSECPNVSESVLIEAVTERYAAGPARDQLLAEIDAVYLSDEEFEELLRELE